MRRRRKSKNPGHREDYQDQETAKRIEEADERFRKMLNPVESYVMAIQSVLVWENEKYSAAVFIVVNILFWLATTTRFYHLVGLTGLIIVFTDMWTTKIWPEIRVPPPPNADNEEWTPVHLRLLSVPELSSYLAQYWVQVSSTVAWVIKLRKTSHFKFFVLMSFLLSGLAMLGTYISGIMMLYLAVMSIFTVPALIYHNITPHVLDLIHPVVLKIDAIFNVKRVKTKKGRRRGREEARESTMEESSSDEEIREFVPPVVPAIVKSDNKSLLTPDTPSREASDYESHDEEMSFATGLRSMPGIDDSQLDESHSECGSRLEVPDMELEGSDVSESEQDLTLTRDPDKDNGTSDMQFVSTHFKEPTPSESDEDSETKGLKFPDFRDVDDQDGQEQDFRTSLLGAVANQLPSSLTADLMTKTVSSLMSSTVAGLSKLGQTISQPQGKPAKPKPMLESVESDIMAEFEFLDDEDLDIDTSADTEKK